MADITTITSIRKDAPALGWEDPLFPAAVDDGDDSLDAQTECREVVMKLIRDLTPMIGETRAAHIGFSVAGEIDCALQAVEAEEAGS